MSFLSSLFAWYADSRKAWWERYSVRIDRVGVHVEESPFRKRPVQRSVRWDEVERVGIRDGGLASDVFYIYSSAANDPVLVPVQAPGAAGLEEELRERGLHPDEEPLEAVHTAGVAGHGWSADEG